MKCKSLHLSVGNANNYIINEKLHPLRKELFQSLQTSLQLTQQNFPQKK